MSSTPPRRSRRSELEVATVVVVVVVAAAAWALTVDRMAGMSTAPSASLPADATEGRVPTPLS